MELISQFNSAKLNGRTVEAAVFSLNSKTLPAFFSPSFLPFWLLHNQCLIEAHDQVAAKCFEMPAAVENGSSPMSSALMLADAVRVIGIQKKSGEPLVSAQASSR